MISEEASRTASQCRHYAMCKIDFLQTGLCPAGAENHFVSYYPQGRMDIVHGLAESRIPVTEGLVDIAKTCTLCGICDKQCYFVTELRPMKAMKAFKKFVNDYIKADKEVMVPETDLLLDQFREVVGERWATNDPAILACYAHDPGIFTGIQTPKYVVMPFSREEVSSIIRICNQHEVPYCVRGNGSSTVGIVFVKDGLVMDMGRMKEITLDKSNWYASVAPGVSAFDLQKRVSESGLRVNVAEPEALVCANLICSGILSSFSTSYGIGASNFINAEFVGPDGRIFHLNQREAPNLFAFQGEQGPFGAICTRADIKIHVKTEDEDSILVPFSNFRGALAFAQELGMRRIGLAVTVLNPEYMATFMAPTTALADCMKRSLRDDLGIEYAVLVLGDQYALEAVQRMANVTIDSELMKTLVLGMPNMANEDWKDLLQGLEGGRPPFEIILQPEMQPLIEAVLNPSPELISQAVDSDLQDFFMDLYGRPEMTDMVWLNMFRIISPKMGRRKHMVPFLVYVPLDNAELVADLRDAFYQIGERFNLTNDFGFITPVDFGKRAIFEYDYYVNQRDRSEILRAQQAFEQTVGMIDRFSRTDARVKSIMSLLGHGSSRMENILYL